VTTFLTIRDVADELGVDADTVYRWCTVESGSRSMLPSVRQGGALRFVTREDLDSFIERESDVITEAHSRYVNGL